MAKKLAIWTCMVVMSLGLSACREHGDRGGGRVSEQAVLDVLDRYDRAWREKDTATVSTIMTEEYLYFSSRGGVRSRRWLLNDLLGSPTYRIDSLYRSDLEIRLYNNTAVVGSRWQGYGSYEGTRIEDRQRCSLVFVFSNAQPRLAAEHCTDIDS